MPRPALSLWLSPLSTPIVSPIGPSVIDPKSAKARPGPYENQPVTRGRIRRLIFGIDWRRKLALSNRDYGAHPRNGRRNHVGLS